MVDGLAIIPALPFATALSTALSSLPAVDRVGIGEFSISDMRAWSIAKADEHRRYILAFHAIDNILAPIHRLPPEILSKIFVEAWQDRKSLQLTHVCRLWRSLLLDNSQFWAVAIAGDEFSLQSDGTRVPVTDEGYLGAVCLRSAPRNISLHLSSISSEAHLQLIQHADRITSMRITARAPGHLELLWKVLHTGVPRLEKLAIRVTPSVRGWVVLKKLSTEEVPLLTRLTLPARLFRRCWPNTLQEISLRSDHGNAECQAVSPSMVSLDRVLRSLEDYPSLRVLDIRDGALFHDAHSSPPSRAFPLLELLRIRSEQVTVSTILSLLAFPPSTHVDIGIIHMQRHPQGKLFLPGSALDGVAALIDQVIIRSGLTSTIHGHTGGAERLRFTTSLREWGPSPGSHTRARLASPPSTAPRARAAQARGVAGQTIFPAFPRLTHLAVHGRSIWCSELLDALRPPPRRAPSSDSESAPLALPLLKDLAVGFATKRRSAMSRTLSGRRSDVAHYADYDSVVFVHFRECCRIFDGVLDGRRTEGSRLSRMEFFSYEEGCMAKPRDSNPDPAVSHVDLAALRRALVDRDIEPLRELVDGPVVFSGYRFFTQA